MLKFLLILLVLGTCSVFPQNVVRPSLRPRLDSNRPSVYLGYICQSKAKAYLRMYNNTVWPLRVSVDEITPAGNQPLPPSNGTDIDSARSDKEISLQYRVDKFALPWENVRVPKIPLPDNGFSTWIPSGSSVLFGVPLDYLKKDLQVFVRFNYDWEMPKQGAFDSSPEHRVTYRGIDLPGNPSSCEK